MTTSIYDIPIKSWDGKENFLDKYKGKVSLVINVTGNCGNAPEYGVIEQIYRTYKDSGFEVIAVPTNQYCGPGITYNEWEDGISCALDARTYAQQEFDVTYYFTDLVNSKPGKPASPEIMEREYPGRDIEFPKQLPAGESPHELYQEITKQVAEINKTLPNNNFGQGEYMFGNFEKYLIGKDGQVIKWYFNGTLMDFTNEKDSFAGTGIHVGTADEEYKTLCEDIEAALAA